MDREKVVNLPAELQKRSLGEFLANLTPFPPEHLIAEGLDEDSNDPVYVLADGSGIYEKRRNDWHPLSPKQVDKIREKLEESHV